MRSLLHQLSMEQLFNTEMQWRTTQKDEEGESKPAAVVGKPEAADEDEEESKPETGTTAKDIEDNGNKATAEAKKSTISSTHLHPEDVFSSDDSFENGDKDQKIAKEGIGDEIPTVMKRKYTTMDTGVFEKEDTSKKRKSQKNRVTTKSAQMSARTSARLCPRLSAPPPVRGSTRPSTLP